MHHGIFNDFISSPEDLNLKYQFSNFLRLARTISILITLLLPAIYLAVTNIHQELLPTEFLFAIVSAREKVPFPVLFEILIMEFSFELIREAGLRVPSPIGSTIGIVGALILGQAAVDANIVSPILIIIVGLTGISSFAIPDFSLGFHCRIARFLYILLGYALGFLGIALGLFIHLGIFTSLKSFGVPYTGNFFNYNYSTDNKHIFLQAPWKREHRLPMLNSKRRNKQNSICMKWKYINKENLK